MERLARAAARDPRFAEHRPLGEDAEPRREAVRLAVDPALRFPPHEVAAADLAASPPQLTVAIMGLTGAIGVLPQHYAEAVVREQRRKNPALRRFMDVFHHRLLSLYYRASTKYRLAFAFERAGGRAVDPMTQALRALVGIGTSHLSGRLGVPDHLVLRYAGLFLQHPRNAAGLEALLSDVFQRKVTVQQFRGGRRALPAEECTRLAARDPDPPSFAQLGVSSVLGDRVLDVQGAIRIRIGPMSRQAFADMMPDGRELPVLVALTKLYVGLDLRFDVQLQIGREEVPALALDGTARLGWNTWLKDGPFWHDPDDAILRGDAA
ncbi:MAG: type VI secretion system baseplate subunit TssG [Thalassobaculales bacterium]